MLKDERIEASCMNDINCFDIELEIEIDFTAW